MKRRGFFGFLLAPFLTKLLPKPKLFEWTLGKPLYAMKKDTFFMHPAQKAFYEEDLNMAPMYPILYGQVQMPMARARIVNITVPEGY